MTNYQEGHQKNEKEKLDAKKLPDLIMQIRTLPDSIDTKSKKDLENVITSLPAVLDNIYSLQEDWLKIVSTLGDIVIYLSVHEKRLESASKDFTNLATSYIGKIEATDRTTQANTARSIELFKENLARLQESREQYIQNLQSNTDIFNSILANMTDIPQIQDNTKKIIISEINSLKEEFSGNFEKIEQQNEQLRTQLQVINTNIDEIRKYSVELESKFISPVDVVKTDIFKDKGSDQPIYQIHDIVFSKEEHKISTLEILDKLISRFSNPSTTSLKGSYCKQLLIEARTQVYEKTARIAPRFRLAMDSLIELFHDDLNYDQTVFKSIVEKIRQLRAIYNKASVIAE